jgi:hydrogenase expression/formation protein HypC
MCLAIPGEVLELFERDGLRFAAVRFGSVRRDICVEYEPEAKPGEYVLVHVGVAIARIDAEQAAATLRALEELGAATDVAEESDRE